MCLDTQSMHRQSMSCKEMYSVGMHVSSQLETRCDASCHNTAAVPRAAAHDGAAQPRPGGPAVAAAARRPRRRHERRGHDDTRCVACTDLGLLAPSGLLVWDLFLCKVAAGMLMEGFELPSHAPHFATSLAAVKATSMRILKPGLLLRERRWGCCM